MGMLRQLLWWGQLAGCYLFVLFSPFWTWAAEWALAFALAWWVLDWLVEFPRPFPVFFLAFPVVFFFIVLLLSAWQGLSFSRSLVFISKQWVILALFFFALRLKDEALRRRLILLFGISAGLAALYSVAQVFTGWQLGLPEPPPPIGPRFRATGFFSVLLSFSLYFSLAALAFLACGWPARKTTAGKMLLGVAGLCYVVVLLNAGRGGFLSLFGGALLWFLLSRENKKRYVLAGAALLTLIAWGINPAVFSRFKAFKGYEFEPSAENRRMAVWNRSYGIFQEQPIFGIGPDNFTAAYAEKIRGTSAKPLGHAHNDFLNVLVYSGLVGLAAFVFFWKELALRLWQGFRQNRSSPPLLMGLSVLAAYLVYAQFESSLIYREIRMVLFFLVGCSLSALQVRPTIEAAGKKS